jgi:hypothetical protein
LAQSRWLSVGAKFEHIVLGRFNRIIAIFTDIVTSDRACSPSGSSLAKAMKKISYDGYRFRPEIIQRSGCISGSL